MPRCATCEQDLARTEFSSAQLKLTGGKRRCNTCIAAAEMAKTMEENPPPVGNPLAQPGEMLTCHIEERPGGGRALTAARAFEAGELVLREPPALTWPSTDPAQLVTGFLSAAPEVQKSVLELAVPAEDAGLDQIDDASEREAMRAARAARVKERASLASELASEFEGSSRVLELVGHLLLLADTSAHAFEGKVGLFPLAALVNHACDPSCAHSTQVGGEMRLIATRALAVGDELTISYLPRLYATPREERRRALLLQKRVFCRCARCTAPDDCRGLRCANAGCAGAAERSDGAARGADGAAVACWRCDTCAAEHTEEAMAAPLAQEAALLGRAAALREAAAASASATAAVQAAVAADAQAAIAEAREELSPSHYLGPTLLSLLASLEPPQKPRAAASTAAHALATLECAAARCHSRSCARAGVTQHPACPELVGEAVTAALACASGGSADVVAAAAVIACRYLPWAVRQFGAQDRSVKTMQAVLNKVTPPKK